MTRSPKVLRSDAAWFEQRARQVGSRGQMGRSLARDYLKAARDLRTKADQLEKEGGA